MNDIAVTVNNVSMMFNMSIDKVTGLKEYIIKLVKRKLFFEEFWALKEVSLQIKRGEVFGVMGLNGAGKSTLLKIIAGVFKPTTGSVTLNGLVAPLIELGTGFDPELSAKENIYMNGAMFGHSKSFMDSMYDSIIQFSELEEFQHVPIKNFSTGMVGRLGFAIATSVKPDILITDEILSVGDFKFQEKCKARMNDMIKTGTAVLLVAHDLKTIQDMCTRAVLLEKGRIVCIGNSKEVCKIYQERY
jgi:ABC-type polysaccharide/polyol phosphate transport system ATPase subunit